MAAYDVGPPALIGLSLGLNHVMASCSGGSPFQGFLTPILLRIKGESPP